MARPYLLAMPSNLLICDLETPREYCKKCGQEFEREFISVRDLDEYARVINRCIALRKVFIVRKASVAWPIIKYEIGKVGIITSH